MTQALLFAADTPRRKPRPAPIIDAPEERRLAKVAQAVKDLMGDGQWRTHAEIAAACSCTETGASARLRELRRLHGAKIERRSRSGKLFEYRIAEGAAR